MHTPGAVVKHVEKRRCPSCTPCHHLISTHLSTQLLYTVHLGCKSVLHVHRRPYLHATPFLHRRCITFCRLASPHHFIPSVHNLHTFHYPYRMHRRCNSTPLHPTSFAGQFYDAQPQVHCSDHTFAPQASFFAIHLHTTTPLPLLCTP